MVLALAVMLGLHNYYDVIEVQYIEFAMQSYSL